MFGYRNKILVFMLLLEYVFIDVAKSTYKYIVNYNFYYNRSIGYFNPLCKCKYITLVEAKPVVICEAWPKRTPGSRAVCTEDRSYNHWNDEQTQSYKESQTDIHFMQCGHKPVYFKRETLILYFVFMLEFKSKLKKKKKKYKKKFTYTINHNKPNLKWSGKNSVHPWHFNMVTSVFLLWFSNTHWPTGYQPIDDGRIW